MQNSQRICHEIKSQSKSKYIQGSSRCLVIRLITGLNSWFDQFTPTLILPIEGVAVEVWIMSLLKQLPLSAGKKVWVPLNPFGREKKWQKQKSMFIRSYNRCNTLKCCTHSLLAASVLCVIKKQLRDQVNNHFIEGIFQQTCAIFRPIDFVQLEDPYLLVTQKQAKHKSKVWFLSMRRRAE